MIKLPIMILYDFYENNWLNICMNMNMCDQLSYWLLTLIGYNDLVFIPHRLSVHMLFYMVFYLCPGNNFVVHEWISISYGRSVWHIKSVCRAKEPRPFLLSDFSLTTASNRRLLHSLLQKQSFISSCIQSTFYYLRKSSVTS